MVCMIGKNAVKLDIAHEYPKLHPVFNVSLLAKYFHPNTFDNRGMETGIKQRYYDDKMVVDWSKLKSVLDVKQVSKNKFQYLVTWKNTTVGEDTWISQDHLPSYLTSYFENFKQVFYENEDRNKRKRKAII